MFTTPILAFANIPFYKTSSQPVTAPSLQDELTIWRPPVLMATEAQGFILKS